MSIFTMFVLSVYIKCILYKFIIIYTIQSAFMLFKCYKLAIKETTACLLITFPQKNNCFKYRLK